MRALIRALGKDHTVLVSTHILSEVEATCTRALVIAQGRLVAEGSIDAIRARRKGGRDAPAPASPSAGTLRRRRGLRLGHRRRGPRHCRGPATAPPRTLTIELDRAIDAGDAIEAVVGALVAAGVGVREVVPRADSLEQVFSELTRVAE